ncbi:MAG: PssE/Cps14G family polysaccharide biosynthesis glycosyltransferase [Candidatus Aenigmarchaeota archaeon]|nr:PssE/Cps14G family polysaccharide biosynthesis glycosyltransferase [Candidatus Aenigmarchaeota archaeon]
MILVTVGTHDQGFPRLIKAIDNLARNIKERVILQIGYSKYKPKNCEWFEFIPYENFIELCRESNLIITHGGVGSIMISLQFKKPTVVVPRLKKFNEHVDDHQLQIAKELEKQKRVIVVYDIKELSNAIQRAKKFAVFRIRGRNRILNIIEKFVREVEHG